MSENDVAAELAALERRADEYRDRLVCETNRDARIIIRDELAAIRRAKADLRKRL